MEAHRIHRDRPRARTQLCPATRTIKDTPSWMRSIPYTCQHLPSERLTHIIQVDHVTQYHHHPAYPPKANLCLVYWRPTCLLLPQDKQYLLKQGFTPIHDSPNQIRPDTNIPSDHVPAQWTSTTTWRPTVELLDHIIASWPLQALAHISKSNAKIRSNNTFWQDAGQLAQGIDLHSPLQGIPASVLSEIGVLVSPERVNPDMDIHPTGFIQLIISDGNAHSYDFSGHYAGSITLTRLHYIRLDHALTQEELSKETPTSFAQECPPDTAVRKVASLPDTIHALLVNKGVHRQQGQNRMLHPIGRLDDNIQHALRLCFSTTTEWITDPLSRIPELEYFASFDTHDTGFGAMFDAYNHTWQGSGQVKPTTLDLTATLRALK